MGGHFIVWVRPEGSMLGSSLRNFFPSSYVTLYILSCELVAKVHFCEGLYPLPTIFYSCICETYQVLDFTH